MRSWKAKWIIVFLGIWWLGVLSFTNFAIPSIPEDLTDGVYLIRPTGGIEKLRELKLADKNKGGYDSQLEIPQGYEIPFIVGSLRDSRQISSGHVLIKLPTKKPELLRVTTGFRSHDTGLIEFSSLFSGPTLEWYSSPHLVPREERKYYRPPYNVTIKTLKGGTLVDFYGPVYLESDDPVVAVMILHTTLGNHFFAVEVGWAGFYIRDSSPAFLLERLEAPWQNEQELLQSSLWKGEGGDFEAEEVGMLVSIHVSSSSTIALYYPGTQSRLSSDIRAYPLRVVIDSTDPEEEREQLQALVNQKVSLTVTRSGSNIFEVDWRELLASKPFQKGHRRFILTDGAYMGHIKIEE